jgi:23S rRNA (cytidine1920-2'-O)/16S rRNA (cytidine1409-2'-O)-methyltransferase
MRADQLLVARGMASSRAQAQRIITAGVRWRSLDGPVTDWKNVAKNGDEVPEGAELEMSDSGEARYVSRGGLKLEGALKTSGVAVTGLVCLDLGQSTGGFTDCLLQQGAAQVLGVDVGHGQLHAMLREDARVQCVERTNARDPVALAEAIGEFHPDATGDLFDLVVGDLSFISQTLVLPAVIPWLKPGGQLLMLVKPQFELQPHQVGKGVVRDPALYAEVEQRIRACLDELGLQVKAWFESSITGTDGNREFFVHAIRNKA